MKLLTAVFGFSLLVCDTLGQTAQCVTLPDGCDRGAVHEQAVRSAIAKFEGGWLYGGQEPIVFASAGRNNTLAQIAYSCNNGATPPLMDGKSIRQLLDNVAHCPNRCGSIAVPSNSQCGFGILVAEDATDTCWTGVMNARPRGQLPEDRDRIGTFKYIDCWSDDSATRALPLGPITAADMTLEKCISIAGAYKYAGLKNGNQCFWGNTKSAASTLVSGFCNKACAGRSLNICGDQDALSMYENTEFTAPDDTGLLNPGVGPFSFKGCYIDSETRILGPNSYKEPGMTVAKCLQTALDARARYAGLQDGWECFYGSAFSSNAAFSNGCNRACDGNSTETCGGGWRLAVYENRLEGGVNPAVNPGIDSWENRGCFKDGETPETRVFPNSTTDNSLTVAKCIEKAQMEGAKYAALQYGIECFFGDEMKAMERASECITPCGGDAHEACGGGWRLQVYEDIEWIDPNPTLAMALDHLRELLAELQKLYDMLEEWEIAVLDFQPLERRGNLSKRLWPAILARLAARAFTHSRDRVPRRALQSFRDVRSGNAPRNVRRFTTEAMTSTMQSLQTRINELSTIIGNIMRHDVGTAIGRNLVLTDISATKLLFYGGAGFAFVAYTKKLIDDIIDFNTDRDPPPTQTKTTTAASSTEMSTTESTSSSSTSSSSSSTSSETEDPTETPDPYVLTTVEGATLKEFRDLVDALPHDDRTWEFTSTWVDCMVFRTYMNATTAKLLQKSPIVDAISLDMELRDPGDVFREVPADQMNSQKTQGKPPSKQPEHANDTLSSSSKSLGHGKLEKRAPNQHWIAQLEAPPQLSWITAKWRQTRDHTGLLWWNIEDHVFDSWSEVPESQRPPVTPRVFVLDQGFEPHPDTKSSVVESYRLDIDRPGKWPLTPPPDNPNDPDPSIMARLHGTCMASLVGGYAYGFAKSNVDIVTVEIDSLGSLVRAVLESAVWAVSTYAGRAKETRVVISLSGDIDLVRYNKENRPEVPFPSDETLEGRDTLRAALRTAYRAGIVVVNAAGNNRQTVPDLTFRICTPQRTGGTESPLIVVGAVDWEDQVAEFSTSNDPLRRGILSLYNFGVNTQCAGLQGNIRITEGTSAATATVSGLVAYLMNDPYHWQQIVEYARSILQPQEPGLPLRAFLSRAAKEYLMRISREAKFDVVSPGEPPIAKVALDFGIRCPNNAPAATFPTSQDMPPLTDYADVEFISLVKSDVQNLDYPSWTFCARHF